MSPDPLGIHEFPAWLGAATVRELRTGLRAKGVVGVLVALQLLLGLAAIGAVIVAPLDPEGAHGIAEAATWGGAALILFVIFPRRASGALHHDRDSGLLDLLQLTPLSSAGVVFGKWLSLAIQTLLFLTLLLPLFALRFFLSGADLLADATALSLLFALSLLLQAFFVMISVLPRGVRVAANVGLLIGALGIVTTGMNFFMMRTMGGGAGRASLMFGSLSLGDGAVTGLLILGCGVAYFLFVAAQIVAAPAENFAGRARLALLAAVGTFVAGRALMTSSAPTAAELGLLLLLGIGVVAACELGAGTVVLPAQVPARLQGRAAGAWLALPFLPTWPSALLFHLLLAGLVLAVALTGAGPVPKGFALVPHAFALVLLPRAVLCWMRKPPFNGSRGIDLVFHVGLASTTLLSAGIAAGQKVKLELLMLFPGTGFWYGLTDRRARDEEVVFMAGCCWALAALALLVIRAAPEWRRNWRLIRRGEPSTA